MAQVLAGESLHDLRLEDGHIVIGVTSTPVVGVVARVEAGAARNRTTATRVVGGALIAGGVGAIVGGRARKNESKIYVVLDLPDGRSISRTAPAREEERAREFVGNVNAAARA